MMEPLHDAPHRLPRDPSDVPSSSNLGPEPTGKKNRGAQDRLEEASGQRSSHSVVRLCASTGSELAERQLMAVVLPRAGVGTQCRAERTPRVGLGNRLYS